MTFATEILKPDSERFALVRISAKKLLQDAVDLGGDVYSFTVPAGMNINDIIVNPTDDDPTWTYSGTTLLVTSTNDLTSASNYAVLEHYIYATGSVARVTSSAGNGIPDAVWEPILLSYPSSTQTMKDIADGYLTISSSRVEISTTDRLIQTYLGPDDTFSQCDIKVWTCVNDVSISKVSFEGVIIGISIEDGQATFNVLDTFLKLNDTGRFGDYEDAYYYTGSQIAANPEASDNFSAAHMVLGKSSPFKLSKGAFPGESLVTTETEVYHVTGGLKLVSDLPANYDQADTVSFFVGRFIGTTLKKMNFGTVTRCYRQYKYYNGGAKVNGVYAFQTVYHIQCSDFYGEIGDCLPDGLPGVEADPVWVIRNEDYTGPDAANYQFMCVTQGRRWTSTSSPGSDALLSNPTLVDNSYDSYCVFRSNVSAITFFDSGAANNADSYDAIYYMNQYTNSGISYVFSVNPSIISVGTIGGETVSALYIDIDFSLLQTTVSGFHSPILPFNKSEHSNWQCRFSPSLSISHGRAMKFIVKSAGLSTYDASFTQADSDLVADVSMTFPDVGEKEFKTYLEEAQYLAKSTLGLLKINEDREVVYEILQNPSAATVDHERDNANILVNSFSTSINYQEIATEVVFENPQLLNYAAIESITVGPGSRVTNLRAKYLHGMDKTITYQHGLADIQNRKEAIAGYLSEPRVEYSQSTAAEDLASGIGDVVEITHKSVAGESETVRALITEVENSPGKSTIRLNELRGVP